MSASEQWVRNRAKFSDAPGVWHLVKPRSERSWFGAMTAACGFNPNIRRENSFGRPTDGRMCRKCERATAA